MTCDEAEILLHALIDGELDAGHARAVEAHVASCARCAAALAQYRALRQAMGAADLRFQAPPGLRTRISARLPAPARGTDRRTLLKGFALGTVLSTAMAASIALVVFRDEREQRIAGEVVAAHLRSLQAEHLTDVQSTDQHTVKPWFSGRLPIAPPVADLTAQGFTLIGGRLDYVDGKPVAALVYRRRAHVINLFVAEAAGMSAPTAETIQGFNVRHWVDAGLEFWAVSDIDAGELQEFADKFQAAMRASGGA
jgi:anti-sigma factor RsiW